MADCVDLTSDAEGSAGTPKAAAAAGPPADDCICLLSSDADSPPQPARRIPSSDNAAAGLGGLGGDAAPAAAASPEQAGGRRARRARTLRSAYGDEFVCDMAALASPPELQSPSPKRRRKSGPGAAALATPESVGAPVPDEAEAGAEADADYRQSPELPSPPSQPARGRRGRLTAEEKAEREAAKAAEKERRQRERAEARELRKQEQATAKAARQAEAAQRRLDRRRETGKTALADMTVHLDPELAKHRTGRETMRVLEEAFGAAGSEGPAIELSCRLPLWPLRSLTWSRAVHGSSSQQASQQSQEGASAAVQQAIPYAAVCFTAEEFVAAVEADGLRALVQRAARECGGCTLLLLIEGLEHYLAQRQRRDFQAHGPGGGGFSRAPIVDFLGGMACRWPGVRHCCVADAAAAAEHLAGLTRALAEQPFRAEAAYVSSFGAGKPDSQAMGELLRKAPLPDAGRQAWFRALACIPSLGPQIAHVVCATHASMGALIAAYQSHPGGEQQRRAMLADLVRFGGQRVGPANSRKVCDVLTGEDPALCIQDAR